MKKALVLGVLAIFAIATVQSVNAQDRKPVKSTKKDAKTEKAAKQKESPVKPKAASWEETKAVKSATTTEINEGKEGKESKACCEKDKKECVKETGKVSDTKNVNKNTFEKDPTVKQGSKEKPAIGVPPTPKKEKPASAGKAESKPKAER